MSGQRASHGEGEQGARPPLPWEGEELWTAAQVARELGLASAAVARRQLSRWGVRAVLRLPGQGGPALYPAEEVRAAAARRRRPEQQ